MSTALTTAEIARRAGVTEKTMFRYFPSKNDLVRRVLFPTMLQRGLTWQWETREKQIKAQGPEPEGLVHRGRQRGGDGDGGQRTRELPAPSRLGR